MLFKPELASTKVGRKLIMGTQPYHLLLLLFHSPAQMSANLCLPNCSLALPDASAKPCMASPCMQTRRFSVCFLAGPGAQQHAVLRSSKSRNGACSPNHPRWCLEHFKSQIKMRPAFLSSSSELGPLSLHTDDRFYSGKRSLSCPPV